MSTTIFTYEEALAVFPRVERITRDAVRQVEALYRGIEELEAGEAPEVDEAYRSIVERWAARVAAVGGVAKGVWLVDFDSGDGYYCWQWPESTITHYHGYDEGFQGRMPIV